MEKTLLNKFPNLAQKCSCCRLKVMPWLVMSESLVIYRSSQTAPLAAHWMANQVQAFLFNL